MKLSEIKKDLATTVLDRIRANIDNKLYEKLIQTMSAEKTRLFLDSEFTKYILNTFIYSAIGYLTPEEMVSFLQDNIVVQQNEKEVTALLTCPCGITRSDCTYHK